MVRPRLLSLLQRVVDRVTKEERWKERESEETSFLQSALVQVLCCMRGVKWKGE